MGTPAPQASAGERSRSLIDRTSWIGARSSPTVRPADRPEPRVAAFVLLAATALTTLVPAPALAQAAGGLDSGGPAWHPDPVPQGTVFEVFLPADLAVSGTRPERLEATFAGEPLHFDEREGGGWVALAAAPVDAEGGLPLRVEIPVADGGGTLLTATVPVESGRYRMEELTVAPEFGRPQPAEIQRRIDEEFNRAMAVSRESHRTSRMWEAPFVPPRESRITSGFGHGRVFNGEVQSRHTGTDFAGAVGAPIVAPARGVATLVDEFYLGGNVIYLDHGAGLVTAYLHLSEQLVAEGDLVEPGQLIGRVGATGRVTGPHLHWIVRYGEISVAGTSLLDLP